MVRSTKVLGHAVTERSLTQAPLRLLHAVCCALRQGILSTLSQSTQLKPVMDGCSIQGELMAFIFLAPQKLGKSTMTCLLRLHGTEKDLTNYIIHVYLLS